MRIERLVVDGGLGLEGHHARALQAAVVAELTRALVTHPGWMPRAARTLTAGPLALPSTATGSAGRATAQALSTVLTREGTRR